MWYRYRFVFGQLAHSRLIKVLDDFRETDQSLWQALVEFQRLILDATSATSGKGMLFEGEGFDSLLEEAKALPLEPVTEPEPKWGRVKFFTRKDDKNFGFLEDDTHFHLNQGIVLGCNGGDVPVESHKEMTHPKSGDLLVYQRVQTKKGFTASWWAFAVTYDTAIEAINARPVIRYRDLFGPVRWQGKDLNKLRALYPRSLATSHLWDPERFVFEKQEGGEWVRIDDPR